jgi:hypothetical protein
MVDYLLHSEPEPKGRAYNPFPPGHIVKGSGTDVTLTYLKSQPRRWLFHQELILALGRSKGEVDWALRQLVNLGLVEAVTHQERHKAPILKYRIKPAAAA